MNFVRDFWSLKRARSVLRMIRITINFKDDKNYPRDVISNEIHPERENKSISLKSKSTLTLKYSFSKVPNSHYSHITTNISQSQILCKDLNAEITLGIHFLPIYMAS